MDKNELDFFLIDGKYYGGDQNWHTHKMMKLGGCSAVCACETCIWLAKTKPSLAGLYPYDTKYISKEDFLRFFETVFQFIHPGIGGLTSVEKFARMLHKYIDTTGVKARTRALGGNMPYAAAREFVRGAIDRGLPVMYLMLKHKDDAFADYEWHWFTLTGYEEVQGGMDVMFATWGKKHSFRLDQAWDTGKAWRGGMVVVED
ncbi:MAG TPA: hypothetical protein DEB31_11705 [Clostridiales bacterium]|nr:hypothetical protein [Clostridiales bacterium]